MKRTGMAAWVTVGVVFVLAFALRYAWIEPAHLGHLCNSDAGPWWCVPRQALIEAFMHNALGYAAVIAAVPAVLLRARRLALVAACLGAAGLVLYCHDWSAVGFTLGVLTLVRTVSAPADKLGGEHGGGEQHA